MYNTVYISDVELQCLKNLNLFLEEFEKILKIIILIVMYLI